MSVVVWQIDFANRTATIAVAGASSRSEADRLPAVVAACRKRGLVVEAVRHAEALPDDVAAYVRTVAAQLGLVVTSTLDSAGTRSGWFGVDLTAGAERPAYRLDVVGAGGALDRIGAFVMLVGEAADLDPVIRGRLRLCVYEMAVNALEHGIFEGEPRLHLELQVASDGVEVSFEDTAATFETRHKMELDIGDKIKNGEKRGLGLFLLAKMAHNLTWERRQGRNRTSFRLTKQHSLKLKTARRPNMEEFSVEVKPAPAKGVTVLRPIGSIDSMTTPTVEGHFESAIDSAQNRIVVDMSEVDFISSAGIGIFLGTVGKLRELGGDLILMAMTPAVQDVFDLLNIEDYFQTISSIDELDATVES